MRPKFRRHSTPDVSRAHQIATRSLTHSYLRHLPPEEAIEEVALGAHVVVRRREEAVLAGAARDEEGRALGARVEALPRHLGCREIQVLV